MKIEQYKNRLRRIKYNDKDNTFSVSFKGTPIEIDGRKTFTKDVKGTGKTIDEAINNLLENEK